MSNHAAEGTCAMTMSEGMVMVQTLWSRSGRQATGAHRAVEANAFAAGSGKLRGECVCCGGEPPGVGLGGSQPGQRLPSRAKASAFAADCQSASRGGPQGGI